jgi:uncharacterized membrane protein YfcA
MASGIAFFRAMVGIGGGSFRVPILTAYSYETYKAVGTAAGIGLIISLQGALLCCLAPCLVMLLWHLRLS